MPSGTLDRSDDSLPVLWLTLTLDSTLSSMMTTDTTVVRH